MLKNTLTYLLLCLSLITQTQNLVYNGNFEIYSNCPTNLGQVANSTGWSNAAQYTTPDYFHTCGVPNYSVPDNNFGYQTDCSNGAGYIGIYTFNYNFPNDGREYVQAKLTDTLRAGLKYLATMHVSMCDEYNYAVKSLGMYFSSNGIQAPPNVGLIITNPQVKGTTLLNDTMNWMKIQDTVTGTGIEQYLTIGNFSYDSLSDTVRVYQMGFAHNNDYSYYYIDSVSVIELNSNSLIEKETHNEIELYPNPTEANFRVSYNLKGDAVLQLSDATGRLIATLDLKSSDTIVEFKNIRLQNGIYLYRIITNTGNQLKTGKIVVLK
jgi:OmpA-OmpF porin, OOP family